MSTKKILLTTLLLIGTLLLTACASNAGDQLILEPTDPPIEDDKPDAYPYPAPVENIVRSGDEQAYPAPDPNIVTGADDPYPSMIDDTISVNMQILQAGDFTPLDADKKLTEGPVFIHNTELVMMESYPVQVQLTVFGDLPSPCHILRLVVSEADEKGNIEIEAYSVTDPEQICVQVVSPFEAYVPIGDFTEGKYTISINGETVNEFELP